MLHAECKVRPLECQDEMTIEPHSKKMKSKEEIYAKLCDDDFQGSHEKTGTRRTSNDLIPSSIFDNQDKHEAQKQENETTVDLELSNEVTLYNKPVLMTSPDSENIQNTSPSFVSKNDAEITKNNCTSKTDYLDKSSVKEESNKSFEVSDGEVAVEEFSTSKAFIGPIYKTENKQDKTKDCAELSTGGGEQNVLLGGRTEEERVKKTKAISCDKQEIDDELYRFYEEIQQIETDNLEDNLEEKESQPSQEHYTEHNYKQTSCGQGIWYTSTQSHYGNEQCFSNEQSSQRTDNERCFENETSSQRIDNEQHFGNQTNGWRAENPSNGQEDYPEPEKGSNFWNFSVPQFRPAWQSTQSFIVPQGPLPPRFSQHLLFQTIRPSPHQPNTFHPHDVHPSHKKFPDYHGNNSHANWNSPLSDQNCSYVGNIDIHNIQVSRNGYSDKDIPVNDHLSEAGEDCWKDTKIYQTKGEHSFSFQQFPEEKLCGSQKLLLILRGLPGSGKTTVSRVLLGQSRDGIVFSTDDYFNQQDGYTYNAGQLGDAHDWNQKRARQAMEQGRSPIIIDNTNTQAWEMKPYVEMALEKGYIVEFREPDTWWKFDPEELEKRNKHGVTREKIAQMLDRYEYQISIPIVMNSVIPPHKSTQRPPPQRRQRETDLKKKLGHRLNKTKQRKKRKRGKKSKNSLINIREKKSDGAHHHLIPDDQETSESEEEDSEEENRKSACTFNGDAGDPVGGCEDGSTGDDAESVESTNLKKGGFPVAVSEISATFDNPTKNNLLAEDKNPLLINSTSISNDNITEHTADEQLTDENQNKILLEKESNSLKINDQNSIIIAEHSSDDYNTVMLNTEDKCKSGQMTCEPNENLSHLYDLKESETSIVLSDKNINDKYISKRNGNYSNVWAFFSINLGDEQLQLDSDRQTSLSAWPEGTHEFICEQRPKKARTPKQTYSDNTVELPHHHSNEEMEKQSSHQTFNEEIVSVPHDSLLSLIDRRDTSTSIFHEVNSEYAPVVPKKKTRKKILKLAPNFNIPRQIAVSTEEGQKDVPLQHDCLSESILETKQKKDFSKKNGERDDQIFKVHECQPSSNNDELIESSPNDVKSLLPNSLYNHMGQSGASLVQKFPNSLCIVSSTTEEEIPPVKQQKICDKKEESLLPDDYIVPLDWKISKMIYFLWKTSVEEKQKKNGFQNRNSLVEISHLGSTMEGPSLPSSI
ncbi:PREDICTED: NEDD4-binding protein 2-like 2 isoform X2 [Crocodylus porosus]|uniref:NEDD4-binding protein 2-like 2 isoform X2 n=1 Tax=Crocodylus porosus TaxID=8502 RepID=UPI00093D9DFC|nr:PREDICTED: NEDD4-binding protein 2-like 2 isoform X2 [Crocodylus porosus]